MPEQDKRQLIETAILDNQVALQNIMRSYVMRFGLATLLDAKSAADDIFTELVVEALQKCDNYDASREAMPWLIGVGLNIIRRKRSKTARQNQREIPIRDLYAATEAQQSDGELFDRVGSTLDAMQQHDSRQHAEELLAQPSDDDAQIIRLAVLDDLDSNMIAEQLAITPTAARVRLHRALKRLRGIIVMEGDNG